MVRIFLLCSLFLTGRLEVLLAPHVTEARLRVHVALDVERGSKTLGTAEEDTCFGGSMDLTNRLEDHVPVGTTKVGRGAKTSNGILFSVCVVDHNVGCVVGLDLCGEVLQED